MLAILAVEDILHSRGNCDRLAVPAKLEIHHAISGSSCFAQVGIDTVLRGGRDPLHLSEPKACAVANRGLRAQRGNLR